jgi:acid phosphatase
MKKSQAAVAFVALLVVASALAYSIGIGPPVPASTSSNLGSSTGSSSSAESSGTQTGAAGSIKHVIIIMMENEAYGQVIGSSSAPYENSLASHYAVASNYFAVSHPSLPNYFALVAGDTFGIGSDCPPSQCSLSNATITNLFDSHGLSWKEYAESMPANCSQSDSADGLYVTKHDPFVYFSAITGNAGSGETSQYCDSHVISFAQFWNDLQASNLPNYSFVTPNVCDDAHSCPLSAGDAWLSTVVPRIMNSTSYSSLAIFVVYDEGSGSSTNSPNQVACILVSPFAKAGFVSSIHYTHYSLLATVEAIFNTGNLGMNDANASAMSDLFTIRISP